jgi:hypothetical protein
MSNTRSPAAPAARSHQRRRAVRRMTDEEMGAVADIFAVSA